MSSEKGSRQASVMHPAHRSLEHVWSYTPLMVVLPAHVCSQPMPVFGRILGSWDTRFVSRTEFIVTAVRGEVHLQALALQLPGWREPSRIDPQGNGLIRVPLSLGDGAIPEYLREVYPFANRGLVDLQHRFFRAVLSIEASFALLPGAAPEKGLILLHSIGHIGEAGLMAETSSGMVIGGPLDQTVIACGCVGKPRVTPASTLTPAPAAAPCTATITVTSLTAKASSSTGLVVTAAYASSNPACDVDMADLTFQEFSGALTPNLTALGTKGATPGSFSASSTYALGIVGPGSTLTVSDATLTVKKFNNPPCTSCTPAFASAGMTCTIT